MIYIYIHTCILIPEVNSIYYSYNISTGSRSDWAPAIII